jgi:Phasin protein
MAIKEKTAPGPFDSWPGADGWTRAWAAVLEANRVALDRWTKVSDTMVKGMFVISQEMTQFAYTRLKEDAENCKTLSHCHSSSEALSCHQRVAEATTAEYLEEANKLTVLMTKIANDGFASMQRAGAQKVSTT